MQSKKSYTLEEAIHKMEHYCAYQERCHQEVTQKLESLNMIPEAIDVVIVHLIEHNFLNESRFAKAFVSGKLYIKKWGKRRLIHELKKKNIGKVNINKSIEEIDYNAYELIFNDLAEKRLQKINEPNLLKKKKKLVDYLIYKGWEPDLVYDKANELIK